MMRGHIRKRSHTTKTGRQTINWYVVVDNGRDAAGKRRQKWHGGFRTRKDAEVARARIVGDLHAGTYVEPTRITLSEWVTERWLPNVETQVKPSTYESYARNMSHHVLPSLGHRLIHDIGPSQLNSLYAELLRSGRRDSTGGLSAKTVSTSTRSSTRPSQMHSMRESPQPTAPREPSHPSHEPEQQVKSNSGKHTNSATFSKKSVGTDCEQRGTFLR